MKFYIPSHLRKLKLIDQVARVIEAYVPDNDIDSFDDYRWYFQNDPIKRFLGLEREVPTKESEETEEEYQERLTDYETEINYLTKLFYTVKGTKKVIEYAQKFIPSLSSANISYSIEELKVEINSLDNEINEDIYAQYLEDFFNALLIFKIFSCNITTVNRTFNDRLSVAIGVGVQPYKINQIITLENADNTKILQKFMGKTVDIILNREFYTGKNSLCLPFTISVEDFENLIGEGTISLIQGTTRSGDTVSLSLRELSSHADDMIYAGQFYVIDLEDSIETISFKDVKIETTVPLEISSCPDIKGTFSKTSKKDLFDEENETAVCGLYFENENYSLET